MGKTEVIGLHIVSAIQLLAIDANPFSTHLIVMAAEEMIRQVATARNVLLAADYRIYIKDEYQNEYLNRMRKAYNWFKHADRDAHSSYGGPTQSDLARVNEMQTLLNIKGHGEIGGTAAPIFADYAAFLAMKYPEYMKSDFLAGHPALKAQRASLSREPEVMSLALQRLLMNKGFLPRW